MLNILCCCDRNFLYPCEVMLYSVKKSQTLPITVYFPVVQKDINIFYEVATFCKKLDITIVPIVFPEEIAGYLEEISNNIEMELKDMQLSVLTYYRLFALKYLPLEIDRILWLDSDIIVKKDIEGFYSQDFCNKLCIACDSSDIQAFDAVSKTSLFKANGGIRYFNAGVIVFNLLQVQKSKCFSPEYIMALIRNNQYCTSRTKLDYFDQGILNALLFGQVLWENPGYFNMGTNQNFYGGLGSDTSRIIAYLSISSILHYASTDKPWTQLDMPNYKAKYWRSYDRELRNILKL